MTDRTQEQVDELLDFYGPEDLDPELEEYLEESEDSWVMIRHPLVYSVMHSDHMNKQLNKVLTYKKEALKKALRQHDWFTYVFLHERAYRIDAFRTLDERWALTARVYWKLLAEIWTDSENIYQNEEDWRNLLTDPRPGHTAMMTKEEKAALAKDFGDEITVYRGFHIEGREQGLSWTTNSITAKFFARRLAREGDTSLMATGTVSRSNVIAFFDGRSETEIVVLPENVKGIKITEVKAKT